MMLMAIIWGIICLLEMCLSLLSQLTGQLDKSVRVLNMVAGLNPHLQCGTPPSYKLVYNPINQRYIYHES